MMKPIIIPEPKEFHFNEGTFSLDGRCVIEGSERAAPLAALLREEIKKLTRFNLPCRPINSSGLWIRITKKTFFLEKKNYRLKSLGEEGYFLIVEPKEISITAPQRVGIFYGIQTLLQLWEDGRRISCGYIRDWPDMKLRGIHIDLKGSMPTFEYLKDLIKKISRYKINTILMEYEDKFKYEKHPAINSPLALSKNQVQELVKMAESHYIQVIPLLQCLGHAEYVLKHEEFQNLREVKEELQQYCPLNPKTLTFFKELSSEILPLHSSKYFHIGGDETWLLGRCKRCKEKVKKEGKLKLYLEYINKVCKYLHNKGKIPILWDDMISRSEKPELIKELTKNAVIMYWDYYAVSPARSYLFWQGTRFSQKWLQKGHEEENAPISGDGFIEEIPELILKIYKKHWYTKGYPKLVNALPYLKYFQDNGYSVIGASEIRAEEKFPTFRRRFLNVREWTRKISKDGGMGVVATSWGRNSSLKAPAYPFDLSWYLIVASGEYCWSAHKVDEEEFDRKFNHRFYGLDNRSVTDALFLLDEVNEGIREWPFLDYVLRMLGEAEAQAKRNVISLQTLKTAVKMFKFKQECEGIFAELEKHYYQIKEGKWLDSRRKRFAEELMRFRKTLQELKKECRGIFGKTMPPSEAEELIKAESAFINKTISEYKILLNKNYWHINKGRQSS